MQDDLERWIVRLFNTGQKHKFYECNEWRALRDSVMAEHHYECQLCKSRGVYSPAEIGHHIKPLRQYPALALTRSNIMPVCSTCHNQIHKTKSGEPCLTPERW